MSESVDNILVVDDNPDNLKVLAEILKEDNYRVRLIKDSSLVISSIESLKPDLILKSSRL